MPSIFLEVEMARYSTGHSDAGEIILKNGKPAQFDDVAKDLDICVRALESIAKNTCCESCHEAGLVAASALDEVFPNA